MKEINVAIVVKTALDFDGRVISQIDSLSKLFDKARFKILLLPDKETTVQFRQNVNIKEIQLVSRFLPKSSFWQLFKMIEYGITTCFELFKLKPDIVHVHDESSILGPLLFKKLRNKTLLIYDDHELKNLPPREFREKLMFFLEKKIFKNADVNIVANNSRKRFVEKIFTPLSEPKIIENWLYQRALKEKPKEGTIKLLDTFSELRKNGKKILLHQGALNENRDVGLVKLIAEHLPEDWILVFIGAKEEQYHNYFKNYTKSYNGGFIYNADLPKIWEKVDSVVIFYSTNTLNNSYCAPNRMFLALNLGIPVIINEKNPELHRLIKLYRNGIGISEETAAERLENFIRHYSEYLHRTKSLKGQFEFNQTTLHPVIKLYDQLNLKKR